MEKLKTYITDYASIQQGTVKSGSTVFFESDSADFSEFSKTLYKKMNLSYPKFFKMDKLCKLAFLNAEIILGKNSAETTENEIAIVLSNAASSLDTDRVHQHSISDREDYFPSPAVFVYTLPNICIGEISIRHNLQTESAFFIQEQYDTACMIHYCEYLLSAGKAEKVLCGWVELYKEEYRSFLYLVEKTGELEHNTTTIKKLFDI